MRNQRKHQNLPPTIPHRKSTTISQWAFLSRIASVGSNTKWRQNTKVSTMRRSSPSISLNRRFWHDHDCNQISLWICRRHRSKTIPHHRSRRAQHQPHPRWRRSTSKHAKRRKMKVKRSAITSRNRIRARSRRMKNFKTSACDGMTRLAMRIAWVRRSKRLCCELRKEMRNPIRIGSRWSARYENAIHRQFQSETLRSLWANLLIWSWRVAAAQFQAGQCRLAQLRNPRRAITASKKNQISFLEASSRRYQWSRRIWRRNQSSCRVNLRMPALIRKMDRISYACCSSQRDGRFSHSLFRDEKNLNDHKKCRNE